MNMDSQLLMHTAEQVRRAGYEVIPVAGKRPLWNDWPGRSMSQAEIAYWIGGKSFNYGIKLRRLLVFDSDGEEADQWLAEHGIESPMEVRTSKGRHVYLRAPDGVEIRTRIRLLLGLPLDALTGADHFTVGPGSWIEKTETRYTIPAGKRLLGPDALPVCPVEVAELLTNRAEMSARLILPAAAPVLDDKTRHWLDLFEPSTAGANGSRACFVACMKVLSRCAGDTAAAWPLLLYFNATKCTPPWDTEAENGADSLKRKLREARRLWSPR